MTVRGATQIELARHAVLRVAAWPIEVVDDFAGAALAQAADVVAVAEMALEQRRERFLARLHAAVPRVTHAPARAWLLRVKRHAHRTVTPLPSSPAGVSAWLEPEIVALLGTEHAARVSLVAATDALTHAYTAELTRQRAALRRHCCEPRFVKALILANPEAAARWTALDRPEGSSARDRRIEATVLHYLMRAVGRPTPQGAWAGVAPIHTSEHQHDEGVLTLSLAPGRYLASVNLALLPTVAAALAATARYRRGHPLRLNPTLFTSEDGWRYERATVSGVRWDRLPAHPFSAAVTEYFGDGAPRQVEPLLDALVAATESAGAVRETLARAIDVLIRRGLLLCGPQVPTRSRDCWDALDGFIADLMEPDRQRWTAASARMRAACDRLSDAFDALTPADVESVRQSIADELRELWQAAGLDGAPPGPAVYLDMRAPLDATWDAATRDRATVAVREMFAFWAADGGAELFRRQMLRDLTRTSAERADAPLVELMAAAQDESFAAHSPAPTDDHPVDGLDTRELVFAQFFDDPAIRRSVAAQTRALDELLGPVRDRPTFTLPVASPQDGVYPGPAGAVLLSPMIDGTIWLGLARPQPGLFVTRFAAVLGDAAQPLLAELRERTAAAASARVALGEVAVSDSPSPNAALRPTVTDVVLTPHAGDGPRLSALHLTLDVARQRPWLRPSAGDEVIAPVYNSGAVAGGADMCSHVLLGLAMGHGWEFPSFGFPASRAERMRWRHLPRLTLPSGGVLSPQRWTLDGETIARLCACRDLERYRVWRAVASRLGLPPLVRVQWGPDRPELMLHTESPLAIRCLFDTVAAATSVLTLVELPAAPSAWPVQDAEGRHYISEVGVTWHTDAYWQTMRPEADNAP